MSTQRFVIIFAICAMLGLYMIFNTGSMNIWKKNMQADIGAGLNRTVTVYTNTGVPIKTWTGKIDLADDEHVINMLINGNRRVIIQGGITIVEEN